MPVQKYMEHSVITDGSMGLSVTDDPLKVKEFQFFYIFDLRNELIIERNFY